VGWKERGEKYFSLGVSNLFEKEERLNLLTPLGKVLCKKR
jgi:hypothetical protein